MNICYMRQKTAGIPFPRLFFTKPKGKIIMKIKSIILPLFAVFAFAVSPVSFANEFEFAQTPIQSEEPIETMDSAVEKSTSDEIISHFVPPLVLAAWYGNIEIVNLLIAEGFNLDLIDSEGDNALISAVEKGHAEVVKILIAAGADLEIKDSDDDTALINAVWKNNIEIVRILLAAGANVNALRESGNTALMIAAQEENVEIIKTLIAAGADVNIKSDLGVTALLKAITAENIEIIKILLAAGAKR